MADEINLDELRLKDTADMTDEDKAFLVEHKAELTDEEVTAFAAFINPEAPENGEDNHEGETEEEKAQREADEAAAAADQPKPPTFKTVAEADKWLDDKKKEWEQENAKAAQEVIDAKAKEEEAGKPIEFFQPGYKPKDYNAFANDMFKVFIANLGKNPTVVQDIRTALGEMTTTEKKQIADINVEFDKELRQMATEGLVPDPTTDEGKKMDKILTNIGARMGLGSMREAFTAYKDLGEAMGVTPVKPTMASQKQKASMVGHGGGGTVTPSKKNYQKDVHKKSMSQIMEDANRELE